ncbi:MAG: hypothetical protein V3U75_12080 [Methylococcaceae bacterium]
MDIIANGNCLINNSANGSAEMAIPVLRELANRGEGIMLCRNIRVGLRKDQTARFFLKRENGNVFRRYSLRLKLLLIIIFTAQVTASPFIPTPGLDYNACRPLHLKVNIKEHMPENALSAKLYKTTPPSATSPRT